jgi:ABC-type multidrug transport system ATPase subunit
MIKINSLTKTYHDGNRNGKDRSDKSQAGKRHASNGRVIRALDGINLEIGPGMFGLLGPNGAGKTTLMRILAGIANPSDGSVDIDGYDLTSDAGKQAVKSMLGYLPQELGMYAELSAYQFVDYMAILNPRPCGRRRPFPPGIRSRSLGTRPGCRSARISGPEPDAPRIDSFR